MRSALQCADGLPKPRLLTSWRTAVSRISDKRRCVPAVVIQHPALPYVRFTLSLRRVEEMLAHRGVDVSCEAVRTWTWKSDQESLLISAGENRRRRSMEILVRSCRRLSPMASDPKALRFSNLALVVAAIGGDCATTIGRRIGAGAFEGMSERAGLQESIIGAALP